MYDPFIAKLTDLEELIRRKARARNLQSDSKRPLYIAFRVDLRKIEITDRTLDVSRCLESTLTTIH